MKDFSEGLKAEAEIDGMYRQEIDKGSLELITWGFSEKKSPLSLF